MTNTSRELAPIIRHAIEIAKKPENTKNYYILLIIVHAPIADMEATKKALIDAASHGLSVRVVNVGDGNFEGLHKLSSDDQPLSHKGWKTKRHNFKFISLNECSVHKNSVSEIQKELSKTIFAGVPEEFIEYANLKEFESMMQQTKPSA